MDYHEQHIRYPGNDTVEVVFYNLGSKRTVTVGSDRAVFRDYADRDLGSP